jgi:hypothetical protein
MPTFALHSDAYLFLKNARRLPAIVVRAVEQATQDASARTWGIFCSPATAHEVWKWFDDLERYSALLPRERWKIRTCQRAKDQIARITL